MRALLAVSVALVLVATFTPSAAARSTVGRYEPPRSAVSFETFAGETKATVTVRDTVASDVAVFLCQDVDGDGSCLQGNELHREYCTGPTAHTFDITGGATLVVYVQPESTLFDLCGYVPATTGTVAVTFV